MRFTPRLAAALTLVILAAVNVADARVPHAALAQRGVGARFIRRG